MKGVKQIHTPDWGQFGSDHVKGVAKRDTLTNRNGRYQMSTLCGVTSVVTPIRIRRKRVQALLVSMNEAKPYYTAKIVEGVA